MNETIHRCATAISLAALSLAGCGGKQAGDAQTSAAQPTPQARQNVVGLSSPQLAHIRTAPVETAVVPIGIVSAPGKVEANANRLSHLVLPLTGRVSRVFVRLGDFVRQGQPLLMLESPDADAAASAYLQAQAGVTQSKSAMAKVQMDLDRERDLLAHGAVPQKDVLNAENLAVQARAGVEQAEAVAEQARRRLQIIGITPGTFGQRVTVHAPISGKLLEIAVVEGEFRNDLSASLMTIADLSSVWVTSDVPETAIRLVKAGEPVTIHLAAYPGETFRGRVTQVGDTVDPETRTVKVRAELPNPGGRFKPEMFGTIQLAEQTELRPVVPAAAVIATDRQTVIWREVGHGVFEKVAVTTGVQLGDRIAIVSGLKPNDRVVVDGVMLLVVNDALPTQEPSR